MTRKLEIEIDAHWLTPGKHYFPLPEGWDAMSPEEQQFVTDTLAAEIVRNRVSATGRTVETRQDDRA